MRREFAARVYRVKIGDEELRDVEVKVKGDRLIIDGRTIEITPGSILYNNPRSQMLDEFGGVIFIVTTILFIIYGLISRPSADLVLNILLILFLPLLVYLLICIIVNRINTLRFGLKIEGRDIIIEGHRKEILPLFDRIEEIFEE